MKKVVVNYSGHPISQDAQALLESEFDIVIQAEPFHFDFSGDANTQLESIAAATLSCIDADSVVTIIPPGQSTLAILLVSYIHGIIGHFPRIYYLELGRNGIYIPKIEYEINAQDIRTAGRFFRIKKFTER